MLSYLPSVFHFLFLFIYFPLVAGESQGHSTGSGNANRVLASAGWAEFGVQGTQVVRICESERRDSWAPTVDIGRGLPWSLAECRSPRGPKEAYRGSGKTLQETNGEAKPFGLSRFTVQRCCNGRALSMAPRARRLICGLFLPYRFLLLSLLFSLLSYLGLICSSPSSFLKGKLYHWVLNLSLFSSTNENNR